MKIAHRTRAHIDLTFIEGLKNLVNSPKSYGIAKQLETPENQLYTFSKIKTLDSEVCVFTKL